MLQPDKEVRPTAQELIAQVYAAPHNTLIRQLTYCSLVMHRISHVHCTYMAGEMYMSEMGVFSHFQIDLHVSMYGSLESPSTHFTYQAPRCQVDTCSANMVPKMCHAGAGA